MARQPFDASRVPGRTTRDDAPLTVSRLAGLIQNALAWALPRTVRVVGEVSNARARTHLYFALKDADAVVNCVIFAPTLRRLRVRPSDGDEVVLEGRIDFYAPQGRVSLVVTRVSPVGAGALDVAFRRLCAELRELGWFDDARKRTPPLLPRRVAVVTSGTGAALQDVLDTLRQRCPAVDVLVLDVLVQGERAAPDIVRALRWVAAMHEAHRIDAVLLTRGGGSLEDLWAFNDRRVAQAVLESPVPVVAGVGHETDTTIAELVADVRAATPTQAAVRVCPDRSALLEQVGAHSSRLGRGLARRLVEARAEARATARHLAQAERALLHAERARLERMSRRLSAVSPTRRLAARRERLSNVRQRLGSALRHRMARIDLERPAAGLERATAGVIRRRHERLSNARQRLQAALRNRVVRVDLKRPEAGLERAAAGATRRRRERLEWLSRRLEAVSPVRVLARGYSVTLGPDGKAVRRADALRPDDVVTTRLASGRVVSRVTGVNAERGDGRSEADE